MPGNYSCKLYTAYPGYQEGPPENILCARPALQIKSVSSWGTLKKGYDIELFSKAVRLFAKAAPAFKSSDTYHIDLIDLSRQVLANKADTVFADMVTAYKKSNIIAFDMAANHFLQLCSLTDSFVKYTSLLQVKHLAATGNECRKYEERKDKQHAESDDADHLLGRTQS